MQMATGGFKFKLPWEKSLQEHLNELTNPILPTGAIIGMPLKLGTKLLIAGTAVAGVAAYSYFQKNGIQQAQTQKAETGGYTITAQPGSTVNIEKPTTGAVEQAQTATATQTDMSWLLIIGIIAIGGLMLLKGGKNG